MAIRKSFYYDPIRQGYDANSWRTISGAPALVGSRLSVDNAAGIGASTIHYVDFVKGEMVFDINVPTVPTAGTSREFGASSPNTSAYILFSFGSTLTCKTSDGVRTTASLPITWNPDWTGANTFFKIRWEAGGAKFFINNTQVHAISDDSVPYGPLSLYLADDSDSSMTVGDIVVKATQSYVLNPKTSDTSVPTTDGKLSMYQGITVSDVFTPQIPVLFAPFSGVLSENVISIGENLGFLVDPLFIPKTGGTTFEQITITEDIALTIV